MNNDDVISTLNGLIETCKDGEEGFKTCVEDANGHHTSLKSVFAERQRGCAAAASELQDLVRAEGGEPKTSSGVGASLHRSWVNIKTAIIGKDEEAVLNECESREDSAAQTYRKALEQDLPTNVRMVVERQYQGVLHNHDQIKKYRDQIKVGASVE